MVGQSSHRNNLCLSIGGRSATGSSCTVVRGENLMKGRPDIVTYSSEGPNPLETTLT